MLIEFSVENFRSIKEKITFSLLASPDKSLDKNLIKNKLKKDNLLKSAVIYGANASGKTNLLLALGFLRALVMNSHTHQKGTGVRFTPFKLDQKWTTKPTKFEIMFIKDKTRYFYSVSFNNKNIIDESLYYYPNERKAKIFERKKTSNYDFTIDKKEQEFLSKRTLENTLYLSSSTQLNYEKTSKALSWFKDNLRVLGPTDHPDFMRFTANLLQKDEKLKKLVLKALLEADLGIDDIKATIRKIPIEEFPIKFPFKFKNVNMNKEGEEIKIQTLHSGIPFDFYTEESEGTQRMFSLIGLWIDALKNGRILVVDELDTKLHHALNIFLVKLFNDPTQNKKNAQLIFATHNTNLLDQDLFRRDQIWFTEKNPKTASTGLYSLLEFSPRKDKNIQRGYLAGRYGAIPFIKDNKIL